MARRSINSQPHSNPAFHASADATLARVCADKAFMRYARKLGEESVRRAIAEHTGK